LFREHQALEEFLEMVVLGVLEVQELLAVLVLPELLDQLVEQTILEAWLAITLEQFNLRII
jgi:hypothetical protein